MQALTGPATDCYLSYIFRYENERGFFERLRAAFARVEQIPFDQLNPEHRVEWVEVYRIGEPRAHPQLPAPADAAGEQ